MIEKTIIKEWEEGESLDNLTHDEVVRMCDESSYIDGHFDGLYIGKTDGKFVFLSRPSKGSEDVLLRRLSGNGYIDRGFFIFDGYSEGPDNIELIGNKHLKHKELSERLKLKGL